MRDDHSVHTLVLLIDRLVQKRRAAGDFPRFAHAVFDAHDVFRLQVFAILHKGRDEEGAVGQAHGERALRAGEQALIIRAVD